MTAICFVCNLPILSHQVGLIWQGGNGWDDLVREQVEESTLKQRLGNKKCQKKPLFQIKNLPTVNLSTVDNDTYNR